MVIHLTQYMFCKNNFLAIFTLAIWLGTNYAFELNYISLSKTVGFTLSP
jgi:hypothetical protein